MSKKCAANDILISMVSGILSRVLGKKMHFGLRGREAGRSSGREAGRSSICIKPIGVV